MDDEVVVVCAESLIDDIYDVVEAAVYEAKIPYTELSEAQVKKLDKIKNDFAVSLDMDLGVLLNKIKKVIHE